jgi:uncharacterized protein (TIGR02147 family)
MRTTLFSEENMRLPPARRNLGKISDFCLYLFSIPHAVRRLKVVNIFEYQDYRKYLRAYYQEMKATRRSFSYRSFSAKAGINAPSFLYYVIEGKRNLTKNSILKISKAIGHSRDEADYFENLVFFNQSRSISEKTTYYSKIVEIRRPIDIQSIEKDRYGYYGAWYHSVVREVVTLFDFKGDFKKLGLFLVPSITAAQAKASILLLERLGFIERDEDGLYHQTQNLIKSKPSSTDAFVIERFQLEMLDVAMKAYSTVRVRDRMTTSTTFSVSKDTFELFKMKIRDFQHELMEIARIDETPTGAYQLSLNLFPVSRTTDESKK